MKISTIHATIALCLLFIGKIAYSAEDDIYDFLWLDPDKKVFVLQNKVFPKKGSLYFDIGYLNSFTGEFQDTSGGALRMGYYLTEEFALELSYAQYSSVNNAAYESVKIVNGSEPFIRRALSQKSVFAVWSPFYGKINTFNKIFYFDWYFGLGTGVFEYESNLKTVTNPALKSRFVQESTTPLQLKTGVRFYLNKKVHIGLEFLNTNYEAASPKRPDLKKWNQQNDLIINLGVSF